LQSSKIPIIVGGTNYYIESLLWHNLVSPGVGKKRKLVDNTDNQEINELPNEVKEFIGNPEMIQVMEDTESTTLFEYLKLIDPLMAHRLHPNNKRKIMR
jgi:tRNA dimethylallyltransferase